MARIAAAFGSRGARDLTGSKIKKALTSLEGLPREPFDFNDNGVIDVLGFDANG